ncbi:MFS transporter [Oricola sp.]|uniref:MFS transporter n=1 Tax=Oricola sp. TaxID=1979950 RepID=UPI0025DB333F|nr:MFS transporter [Oricola sp.]MCI5075765.1 MFS transporter [Oricola sp.]
MDVFRNRQALSLLLLLLVGTVSNSMIVPFMPYYIVEGLGAEPWRISLYTGAAVLLTVTFNRLTGRWLDEGGRFFPLIAASSVAYMAACLTVYLFPAFWVLVTIGALGFAVSGTFMAVVFTFGRQFADRSGLDASRFNAFLRGTTSTAWMLGPAFAFTLVDGIGPHQVFAAAFLIGAIRLVAGLWAVPRTFAGGQDTPAAGANAAGGINTALWQALSACFLLSLAHSLCFVALPLFYTQEVHLPDFAPGLAFSVKTAVEIAIIATTPVMMKRFSHRAILLSASLLALVAIFALWRVTSLPTMIVAQALEGAYYGIYASVGVSFVQSFARNRMGRATSLYVNTIMITGVVSGPAVGLLGQFFSFRTAIGLSSICVLMAIVAFLMVRTNETSALKDAA